jgi:hypothetical protein
MKAHFFTLATAALMLSVAAAAQAEDSAKMNQGGSESSPGHQMQKESSPGASEYAPGQSENRPSGPSDTPGHQMKDETGPGASAYAPGHNIEGDTRKE